MLQLAYSWEKYSERNRAERFMNRIKQSRAIATRYDKLDSMYLEFILTALAVIRESEAPAMSGAPSTLRDRDVLAAVRVRPNACLSVTTIWNNVRTIYWHTEQ